MIATTSRAAIFCCAYPLLSSVGVTDVAAGDTEDKGWRENYDARQRYFESTVGPLPKDILKMLNMTGVWPGGGLFVMPADKLGSNLSMYTTFGLSNSDMPTNVRMADFALESDGKRAQGAEGKLQKKNAPRNRQGLLAMAMRLLSWPRRVSDGHSGFCSGP